MNQGERLLLNFIVAGLEAASGFPVQYDDIVRHIPYLLRFVPSPE
jgi:hypothetical protein